MSDFYSPERVIKMRFSGDTAFNLNFSPVSTSSPISQRNARPERMNPLNLDQEVSIESDSSGDITSQAVQGVDESVVLLDSSDDCKSNNSSNFLPNDVQCIGPLFQEDKVSSLFKQLTEGKSSTFATREQVREFLLKCANEDDLWPRDFFAEIATERILWDTCEVWSGRLSAKALRRCPLALEQLERGGDERYLRNSVELVTQFLSTVGYGRRVSRQACSEFNYGTVSLLVWDRIFTPGVVKKDYDTDSMDLLDYVRFIFAIHGLDDAQSAEYWFRVLDMDGDGILSQAELSLFYMENVNYLQTFNVASMGFRDIICQNSDILGHAEPCLRLSDLKHPLSRRVLSAFVDARRFFEFESDERSNTEREADEQVGLKRNDWCRFIDTTFQEPSSNQLTVSINNSADAVELVTLD